MSPANSNNLDRSAEQPDLIVAPRWIIPVEPAGTVLENHVIAINHGRIMALEERGNARRKWPDAAWEERSEHVLIPGLVNAHTHVPMNLLRGIADDLPLEKWLTQHIWPAEGQWVSPEFVRDGTDLAVLELIRGGTTCFHDMYMFPDQVAAVAAEHGIRAVASIIVIEAPTAWATTVDEYLDKGLEVHDRYRDHPLVRTSFGPHAPYTVSDAALERIVTLANQLELVIQMHVHETANEVSDALQATGKRPLHRLDEHGALTPLLGAVHMTALDDDDIALVAERGVSVIHCPESNMKLASGFCPVSQLQAAGVNVALGTDGAASNNDLDMFGEMRSAALLAKVHSGDAASVPAAKALEMATINGARTVGMDDEIGSLLPGKSADMVCVSLASPSCQPVHNALSQLVYSACREQVTDVWVAGRKLYGDNQFLNADSEEIIARANTWLDRIQASQR